MLLDNLCQCGLPQQPSQPSQPPQALPAQHAPQAKSLTPEQPSEEVERQSCQHVAGFLAQQQVDGEQGSGLPQSQAVLLGQVAANLSSPQQQHGAAQQEEDDNSLQHREQQQQQHARNGLHQASLQGSAGSAEDTVPAGSSSAGASRTAVGEAAPEGVSQAAAATAASPRPAHSQAAAHRAAMDEAAQLWGCRLEVMAERAKPKARRHMSRRQRAHIRHAAEAENQIDDVTGAPEQLDTLDGYLSSASARHHVLDCCMILF